jgi:hypothetical protein
MAELSLASGVATESGNGNELFDGLVTLFPGAPTSHFCQLPGWTVRARMGATSARAMASPRPACRLPAGRQGRHRRGARPPRVRARRVQAGAQSNKPAACGGAMWHGRPRLCGIGVILARAPGEAPGSAGGCCAERS